MVIIERFCFSGNEAHLKADSTNAGVTLRNDPVEK